MHLVRVDLAAGDISLPNVEVNPWQPSAGVAFKSLAPRSYGSPNCTYQTSLWNLTRLGAQLNAAPEWATFR